MCDVGIEKIKNIIKTQEHNVKILKLEEKNMVVVN